MFPKSKALQLPNVPEDLLLPPYNVSRNYKNPIIDVKSKNLPLPSKIYPYAIHSNGAHEYAFNNPCPNESKLKKKYKTQNQEMLLNEIENYSDKINAIVKKMGIQGNFVGTNITKI